MARYYNTNMAQQNKTNQSMHINRHKLGRQGELFVLRELVKIGWMPSTKIKHVDLAVEKDGRIIQIEVKTSLKQMFTIHKGNKGYDYLIFTDLKDLYIIPFELIKSTNKLNRTYKKLKNAYHLLKLSSVALLSGINDCGIGFGELDTTKLFFA